MYSAPRSVWAVALLFISSFSGTVAFPQSARFIRDASDTLPLVNLPVGRAPCRADSSRTSVAPYAAISATTAAGSPCDTPLVRGPSVSPCSSVSIAPIGCGAPRDVVQDELANMGKAGQKILRARERVLEILQTENACSEWFREMDSNPADTFRTIGFEVDRKAEDFVLESKDPDNLNIFRNPYVAKVFQGDGRYAKITINANGAFFSSMARVLEVLKGGGPLTHRGPRATDVGPYAGDTMNAQVLVLLHEFGHALDLLPADENNVDGKSVQNTSEVLRFCRAEIESKTRRNTLSAMR